MKLLQLIPKIHSLLFNHRIPSPSKLLKLRKKEMKQWRILRIKEVINELKTYNSSSTQDDVVARFFHSKGYAVNAQVQLGIPSTKNYKISL